MIDIWNLTGVEIPEGVVYQWNAVALMGEEVGLHALAEYTAAGWREVPSDRHADLPVLYKGCRLMERTKAVHEASFDVAAKKSHLNQIRAMKGEGFDHFVPPGFKLVRPADLPNGPAE